MSESFKGDFLTHTVHPGLHFHISKYATRESRLVHVFIFLLPPLGGIAIRRVCWFVGAFVCSFRPTAALAGRRPAGRWAGECHRRRLAEVCALLVLFLV